MTPSLTALNKNEQSIPPNEKLLERYLQDARRQRLTERTIDNYGSCLQIFFNRIQKNATRVDIEDLRIFLDYLITKKVLADKSISRYYSAFHSFYDFLEFENLVERNIIPVFRKRYLSHLNVRNHQHSERQIISVETMAHLITSILDPRDKAVVTLLAKTGIRRNELRTLDIDDIDWAQQKITLKPTRKRHNRIVFFDSETGEILNRWCVTREKLHPKEKTQALFINEQRTRLNRNGIYTIVTKYAERIGIHDSTSKNLGKRFTTHCCRHWFTTHLLRNGMPREYVKELRGDSRCEAIDIYHHIDPEDLRKSYLACIPELGI